jgi:hypothetical protein
MAISNNDRRGPRSDGGLVEACLVGLTLLVLVLAALRER